MSHGGFQTFHLALCKWKYLWYVILNSFQDLAFREFSFESKSMKDRNLWEKGVMEAEGNILMLDLVSFRVARWCHKEVVNLSLGDLKEIIAG